MCDVLIISGGNAEDLIGATLAAQLEGLEIAALPLVGEGKAYEGKVQAIVGPRQRMPSDGFPFNSFGNLSADLRAGFLPMSFRQWRAAQLEGKQSKVTVVVGDAYALWMGVWFANRQNLFHVNPLVSAYYLESRSLENLNEWGASDFTLFERFWHRWAKGVFVRDALSEKRLRSLGVHKAEFLGSFAMDILPKPERTFPFSLDKPILALLPGTRADVDFSLPLMLESASLLPELQALVAWGPPLERLPLPAGWVFEQQGATWGTARNQEHSVWIVREQFSEVLEAAQIVLGCAGTGNEQSAGLGKPVVGFPTPGPQYTLGFAKRQKQLLGEALSLVEANPSAISQEIRAIMQDSARQQTMQQAGQTRIGKAGALPQIAQRIRESIFRKP